MSAPRGLYLRAVLTVFLAAALFRPAAQVVVDDDIITNEVRFDIEAESPHSIAAAMGLSLVMPGMGHYYIDKPVSAYMYAAVELVSFFGAVVFGALSNQREMEARSYAVMAAGIEQAPKNDSYWRHVGKFMDAAGYNDAVELSRGDEAVLYTDSESWWRWGDESLKDEYNAMRQRSRDLRVASSFFIGAMIANRIVSVIDLRVFQRKSLSRNVKFEPAVGVGSGVTMSVDF